MGFCFDFQGRVFGPVDNGAPLFCIAGPCALESRAHALEVSAALREIFAAAGVPVLADVVDMIQTSACYTSRSSAGKGVNPAYLQGGACSQKSWEEDIHSAL